MSVNAKTEDQGLNTMQRDKAELMQIKGDEKMWTLLPERLAQTQRPRKLWGLVSGENPQARSAANGISG